MERNRTADLLKGLAVIFMIQVHLVELFAAPDIYGSWIGKISLFIGGPPAAPVFMVVMGYYFASSKRSIKSGIIRGLKLILLGFILNAGLNLHLFIMIAKGSIVTSPWPYLFGVDILFLAGLSLIILTIVKHYFNLKLWPYVIIMTLVFFIQFFDTAADQTKFSAYFKAYFMGNGIWWSYFPLIPWLAYPVLGFIFNILMHRFADIYQKVRLHLLIISGIITFVFIGYGLDIASVLPEYYHHGILFFLYTCCFLIFLSIIIEILSNTNETWFSKWAEWLGIHVTAIYVIQWLLIGNLATVFYKTRGYLELVVWFIVVLLITSVFGFLWVRIRMNFNAKYFNLM
ncbi:MAG: hypothetical protein KQH67_09055 [Bacteroidetes bacterium]|nr:hypothetical protein [Bacteroidota bacterium]